MGGHAMEAPAFTGLGEIWQASGPADTDRVNTV
jgi:hypothetical protein